MLYPAALSFAALLLVGPFLLSAGARVVTSARDRIAAARGPVLARAIARERKPGRRAA